MTRVIVVRGKYLKTGDTAPALRLQLIDEDGSPKDLSSAQDVLIGIERANGDTIVDDDLSGNLHIQGESNGYIEYEWRSADTETAATLEGEVVVVDTSGAEETYPNRGSFEVFIEEGIV